jgi:hypothetical protein
MGGDAVFSAFYDLRDKCEPTSLPRVVYLT